MVSVASTYSKTIFDSPEMLFDFAVKVFKRVIWRGADAGRFVGPFAKVEELLMPHLRG
jgi:hypothetical protein